MQLNQESGESARPLRRDAELNRQRIIEAARDVFAERGLDATFDEIAHRARVGIGTLYRRFPTRELLLDAALEGHMERVVELAEQALRMSSAWEGLATFLREAAALSAADRGTRDIILSSGGAGSELARIRERLVPRLAELVSRAKADGSLRADADTHDILLVLFMVTEVAHHSSAIRRNGYRRYLEITIDGLRASAAVGDLGAPFSDADFSVLAEEMRPIPKR